MSYIFPFDEFKELWDSAPLIILDTNGLLNLYRFSPETTEKILEVFASISKEQFWIPAQVLEEYNENHQNVINKEHTKYREVTTEVERIMAVAQNEILKQFMKFTKFKYPLVKELRDKITEAMDKIKSETTTYKEQIKEETKKNERMLKEDKVQLFVDELVQSGHVGAPFNITTLLDIFAEGEQRYKYKIPPGYKDEVKDKNDDTKRRKFGDLILWKQVLNKAKSTSTPIVFITLDEKEDWWLLDKNQTPIRPRDELFIEFKEYSEHPLVIMTLTNFYNHVSIINNMVDHSTYLEMNAESVGGDLIEDKEWAIVLDGDGDLTFYLIHSGELQEFIGFPLSDVETIEFSKPELDLDSVDIDESQVIIEGSFTTNVEIIVTGDFYEKTYTSVEISGSVTFEFEVDYEKDEDFIKKDNLKISTGGYEIISCAYDQGDEYADEYEEEERCIDCGNQETSYFTNNGDPICNRCSKHYDTCPDCGFLFERGTLAGSFCVSCNSNH